MEWLEYELSNLGKMILFFGNGVFYFKFILKNCSYVVFELEYYCI